MLKRLSSSIAATVPDELCVSLFSLYLLYSFSALGDSSLMMLRNGNEIGMLIFFYS